MWKHKEKISIYLATPYSHKSKRVMTSRYMMVNHAASLVMNDPYGFVVFSPITHCHEIAKHYELPTSWDFWRDYDYYFIDVMEELWVYMQTGWDISTGVNAEIEYAKENNKPIVYFDIGPNDNIIIKDYLNNPRSLENYNFIYDVK